MLRHTKATKAMPLAELVQDHYAMHAQLDFRVVHVHRTPPTLNPF